MHKTLMTLAILGASGCLSKPSEPVNDGTDDALTGKQLQEAFEHLSSCTDGVYSMPALAAAIELAQRLQTYPKTQIRTALMDLYESDDGTLPTLEEDAKGFVLLRIYFDVPATMPTNTAEFHGGFMSTADQSTTYHVGWPLTMTTDGTITGVAVCGTSAGPFFGAVGEFDFFDSKFSLRDLSGY